MLLTHAANKGLFPSIPYLRLAIFEPKFPIPTLIQSFPFASNSTPVLTTPIVAPV